MREAGAIKTDKDAAELLGFHLKRIPQMKKAGTAKKQTDMLCQQLLKDARKKRPKVVRATLYTMGGIVNVHDANGAEIATFEYAADLRALTGSYTLDACNELMFRGQVPSGPKA